ncbi:PLP-dependent aminotransferase family protein [Mesorhizobium sp. B2-4-12]|uniref:MocR-like pyridoxine biosynthesis transcription factor PdxR n=1 Tax=Mesorhizobium sp. B2-4-12 TaxID=2589937 RepID=UPI00112998A8|nr:PLP-dependent aminotransferase family protein [Mesorhizobium sp. B2-4-12]TPK88614.1 PLP-dependent aminotransferase family protein [Mesorhizobium sp. B2-4-12]
MGHFEQRPRGTGVTRRIYLSLREQIESGIYKAGAKLPSSRSLAEELGVSRTTVTAAFDQLISEGYVQVRQGSKATVASTGGPSRVCRPQLEPKATPKLSDYARRVMALPSHTSAGLAPLKHDFRYGDIASADFPKLLWRRALNTAFLTYRERLAYEHPAGNPRLRQALEGYLWRARGIRCEAARIIIVSGSQQALDLCARVLVNPGDSVVVEDPCYAMARNVMLAIGAKPVELACDNDGMDTTRLPDPARIALAYVTPSHQFPLGGVLSVGRRQTLIEWASLGNAYVIEDHYDGEYRYDVSPIPPLYLSGQDKVVYVGTVSKTLSPTLRLGYMVVPGPLVDLLILCKQIADRHSSGFEQDALATMIETGAYERHVRRMRRRNAERRTAFLNAMREAFGGEIEIVGTSAGLHVVVWFNSLRSDEEELFAEAARKNDVGIYPVSRLFAAKGDPRAGFIFGYASMAVEAIDKGVAKLFEVFQSKTFHA